MTTRAAEIAKIILEEWPDGERVEDFCRRRLLNEKMSDLKAALAIVDEIEDADESFELAQALGTDDMTAHPASPTESKAASSLIERLEAVNAENSKSKKPPYRVGMLDVNEIGIVLAALKARHSMKEGER